MRYLLDTDVLIRALDEPERLPPGVLAVLRTPEAGPFGVSAITPWEIATQASRGRLHLSRPVSEWLAAALVPEPVTLLALEPAIAVESAHLPGVPPSDPADRRIVATARHHGLTLLTADPALQAYPHLKVFWE
jgi:PIN domain nuclease of toxin-antitoxin system